MMTSLNEQFMGGLAFPMLIQLSHELEVLDHEIEAIPEPLREVINQRVGQARYLMDSVLDQIVRD